MICSKFITFAVTKTTGRKDPAYTGVLWFAQNSLPLRWQRQQRGKSNKLSCSCDLLKIHYLCGDKDNEPVYEYVTLRLWFAQNSLPLRWQRQHKLVVVYFITSCDLLKIHYLCGDKDNSSSVMRIWWLVVICSKFITFAVTKTTAGGYIVNGYLLWFAQNSLPLRWQRQPSRRFIRSSLRCDLLKIHYLCGDKDNLRISLRVL